MRVGIGIVVYAEFPASVFERIMTDVEADVTWFVHCHSSDAKIEQELIRFCRTTRSELCLHRNNRGLSRSWNDAIEASFNSKQDITLIINDDIYFNHGAFNNYLRFLDKNKGYGLAFLYGTEPGAGDSITRSQNFACFAFGESAYARVGAFDENFFPAYYEDIDYWTRMMRLGLPVVVDERVLVHHERNKTTKMCDDLRASIEIAKKANKAYFETKWGGDERNPIFQGPFERFENFIPWEGRRAPYGVGYDRGDLMSESSPPEILRNLGA